MSKQILDLVVIADDLEAMAVRSALEWWGVKVNIHFIGKAQDLIEIFDSNQASHHICIAAHGVKKDGEWGFQLPELSQSISQTQPFNDILLAKDVEEFITVQDKNILSLACGTGSESISSSFAERCIKLHCSA